MSKTIEIIVSPDGQSRVETKGFAGSDCYEASRFLEEALGHRASEQLTPEFYQQQTQAQQTQEGA
jgi:hypothetical protein